MLHRLAMLCALVCGLASVCSAADKRITTPFGYEDYWPGLAAGGRDSLHHRVIFDHRVDHADSIVVQFKDGRFQTIGLSYDHSLVQLELTGFKQWLIVLEYPVRDENLFTTGWEVNLQGQPTQHGKFRWRDVRSVRLHQHGIDTILHPKLP